MTHAETLASDIAANTWLATCNEERPVYVGFAKNGRHVSCPLSSHGAAIEWLKGWTDQVWGIDNLMVFDIRD